MKPATALPYALLLALLALVAVSPSQATVQGEDCIDPAVEYPIPCDEDGD